MATTRVINDETIGKTAITFNEAGAIIGQMTLGDLQAVILRPQDIPTLIAALQEAVA